MLYTILLIASIIVLVIVLYSVITNKLNIRYAMVWIFWAIGMIVISIFPDIVTKISSLLGIKIASNTVFLIFIFLLYCLTFYVFLKISKHNEDILCLNYEVASLKKKIKELEESITKK